MNLKSITIHAIYSLIYVFSLLWCMAYLPAAIDCVRHGAKAQGAKKTKLSRKKNQLYILQCRMCFSFLRNMEHYGLSPLEAALQFLMFFNL